MAIGYPNYYCTDQRPLSWHSRQQDHGCGPSLDKGTLDSRTRERQEDIFFDVGETSQRHERIGGKRLFRVSPLSRTIISKVIRSFFVCFCFVLWNCSFWASGLPGGSLVPSVKYSNSKSFLALVIQRHYPDISYLAVATCLWGLVLSARIQLSSTRSTCFL